MASNEPPKPLPNGGYIYPMVCGSCLKLWVDNQTMQVEETITLFDREVPVKRCPRCIHESGADWPGSKI